MKFVGGAYEHSNILAKYMFHNMPCKKITSSHVKRRCLNNLRSIDKKSAHIINLLVMPVSINAYYLNHLCNAIKHTSFEFKVET